MGRFLTLRETAYVLVPLVLFLLGGTLFVLATQRPTITVPNGPFEIGAGPYPETEIEETRITVSVPERYVDLRIDFTRVDKMCYIYMLMPFNIESVSPVLYINGYPHQENFSRWSDFSYNFTNCRERRSAIVNETLHMNSTLFAAVGLGMLVKLESTPVAITYSMGTTQTAILTFFGNTDDILDESMRIYKQPRPKLALDYPFTVSVQIPQDTYMSMETYPPPNEYYIRGGQRWMLFSLDFLDRPWAKTLFCSFVNPANQTWKEIAIFLGGTFIAIGITIAIEAARTFTKRKGIEEPEAKKTKSEASPPLMDENRKKLLLEEYHELSSSVRDRGRSYVTVQSILISGSLLAVTYVMRNLDDMSKPIAQGSLLGSTLLVVLAGIMYYTTSRVDNIFWRRVHAIEKLVGIEVGHHGIYEKIEAERWFLLRRLFWFLIFLTLSLFFVGALIWTFI